jgi:hypothetical protein
LIKVPTGRPPSRDKTALRKRDIRAAPVGPGLNFQLILSPINRAPESSANRITPAPQACRIRRMARRAQAQPCRDQYKPNFCLTTRRTRTVHEYC